MHSTSWDCPKTAEEYKSDHEITEADFNSRIPTYLIRHDASYVAGKVNAITDCNTPVGVDPAGNIELEVAEGLVYYPAGLFKALLDCNTKTFEMFATQETTEPFRKDVIMKTKTNEDKLSFYDMSSPDGIGK